MTSDPSPPPAPRLWIRPLLFALFMLGLNVAAFVLLPNNLIERMGQYGYLGVFLATLIGNATMVIPVPYPALVIKMAPFLQLPGVVLAGAFGSVLGESIAFFVGRSGSAVVADTSFYRWVQQQMHHPWRAFVVLVALSAPPNPVFDIAGITAGAMGVPFPLFFGAVLLGRGLRFMALALTGMYSAGNG